MSETPKICSYTYPKMHNVIITVGLPARGKSYMSKMLSRYLNWTGKTTRIFNVGEYRRYLMQNKSCDYSFFDPQNQDTFQLREEMAYQLFQECLEWVRENDERIAIFDATNTEVERRKKLREMCVKAHMKPFFIELICDDQDMIEHNIRSFKIRSADYEGFSDEQAYEDFVERIKKYSEVYKPISEETDGDISYLKIINAGKKYYLINHQGHFQTRVSYFLMNTHLGSKVIYLTRHGESMSNLRGKIGGDSELSQFGMRYAEKLGNFIECQEIKNLRIMTSQLKRSIQTSYFICCQRVEMKILDEINAGICDGMTYEEIAKKYPKEFEMRRKNKFNYRYPLGESYKDLIDRLECVILKLERNQNSLVIAHQAVIRCLLAYFCGIDSTVTPYLSVPLNTLFKLTLSAYAVDIVKYTFDNTDCLEGYTTAHITVNDVIKTLIPH